MLLDLRIARVSFIILLLSSLLLLLFLFGFTFLEEELVVCGVVASGQTNVIFLWNARSLGESSWHSTGHLPTLEDNDGPEEDETFSLILLLVVLPLVLIFPIAFNQPVMFGDMMQYVY